MLGSKCISIFATLLALSAYGADAGALPSGVCYSAWHHASVSSEVVQKDLSQIKQYFSSFRTFHASFSGVNVIDAAASAGLKVSVGIQMSDKNGIAGEITAACDGAKRNPGSVAAIYVGNENLENAGFGSFSAGELVGYINQIKSCTAGLNIKVGSVQRINEWLTAAGAAELSAASDSIGVNIYPFFTSGDQKPIEKLEAQWAQMTAKYAEDKLALTETGWPRQGETTSGNVPSKETQQSFLNDFATWSTSHANSYFFMMYDATVSYSGAEYEKYFGLADVNGALQVSIPGGSGSGSDATTQAPAASTAAPSTPAATTPTVTPAPTPAPAPDMTPVTPVTTAPAAGATTTPASTPAADATPAPEANTPEAAMVTTTPSAVVPGPAPTPAATGSGKKGKKDKKTHCD